MEIEQDEIEVIQEEEEYMWFTCVIMNIYSL